MKGRRHGIVGVACGPASRNHHVRGGLSRSDIQSHLHKEDLITHKRTELQVKCRKIGCNNVYKVSAAVCKLNAVSTGLVQHASY